MIYVKILVCSIIFYCGCTISPTASVSRKATFDNSTPAPYPKQNSGLVFMLDTGAVITPHARDRYNAQVVQFKERLLREKSVTLVPDSGVTPYKDAYGNNLFFIDNQHLTYFLVMTTWIKSGIYF